MPCAGDNVKLKQANQVRVTIQLYRVSTETRKSYIVTKTAQGLFENADQSSMQMTAGLGTEVQTYRHT